MNLNFSRSISAMVLALLFDLQIAHADTKSMIDCEARYAKIIGAEDGSNISVKIKSMEQLNAGCSGTGIYEARVAKLYELDGRIDDAVILLRQALQQNLPYQKELLFTLFSSLLAQGNIAEATETAKALIKGYPDWDGGYLSMGQINLLAGEHDEGIRNLEKAASIEGTVNAYLLLTMAYYEKKQFQESVASMQRAYKRSSDAMFHTDAVCAASLSLIAMGYEHDAKELLEKHLEIKPEAKDIPVFVQVMTLVEQGQ